METREEDGGVIVSESSSPFDSLPEDCISNIISFTTPRDACVVASVSKIFDSAVKSDFVWDKFLPPEYESLFPKSRDFSSKRELYFDLGNKHVLFDDAKKVYCSGFENLAIEAGVGIVGEEVTKRLVCFDVKSVFRRRKGRKKRLPKANKREDGWLEIELGEFFNEGGLLNCDELEISASETKTLDRKQGLIIQGIEIRPTRIL